MSGFTTGGNENPALTDNWDDAEGYYSMYYYLCVRTTPRLSLKSHLIMYN